MGRLDMLILYQTVVLEKHSESTDRTRWLTWNITNAHKHFLKMPLQSIPCFPSYFANIQVTAVRSLTSLLELITPDCI